MSETKRKGAIITAYTGVGACPMDIFQDYAENILGRPIMTHEFGDKEVWAELKAASRSDFLDLVHSWYPETDA